MRSEWHPTTLADWLLGLFSDVISTKRNERKRELTRDKNDDFKRIVYLADLARDLYRVCWPENLFPPPQQAIRGICFSKTPMPKTSVSVPRTSGEIQWTTNRRGDWITISPRHGEAKIIAAFARLENVYFDAIRLETLPEEWKVFDGKVSVFLAREGKPEDDLDPVPDMRTALAEGRRDERMSRWKHDAEAKNPRNWTIVAISVDCEGYDSHYKLPSALANDVRHIYALINTAKLDEEFRRFYLPSQASVRQQAFDDVATGRAIFQFEYVDDDNEPSPASPTSLADPSPCADATPFADSSPVTEPSLPPSLDLRESATTPLLGIPEEDSHNAAPVDVPDLAMRRDQNTPPEDNSPSPPAMMSLCEEKKGRRTPVRNVSQEAINQEQSHMKRGSDNQAHSEQLQQKLTEQGHSDRDDSGQKSSQRLGDSEERKRRMPILPSVPKRRKVKGESETTSSSPSTKDHDWRRGWTIVERNECGGAEATDPSTQELVAAPSATAVESDNARPFASESCAAGENAVDERALKARSTESFKEIVGLNEGKREVSMAGNIKSENGHELGGVKITDDASVPGADNAMSASNVDAGMHLAKVENMTPQQHSVTEPPVTSEGRFLSHLAGQVTNLDAVAVTETEAADASSTESKPWRDRRRRKGVHSNRSGACTKGTHPARKKSLPFATERPSGDEQKGGNEPKLRRERPRVSTKRANMLPSKIPVPEREHESEPEPKPKTESQGEVRKSDLSLQGHTRDRTMESEIYEVTCVYKRGGRVRMLDRFCFLSDLMIGRALWLILAQHYTGLNALSLTHDAPTILWNLQMRHQTQSITFHEAAAKCIKAYRDAAANDPELNLPSVLEAVESFLSQKTQKAPRIAVLRAKLLETQRTKEEEYASLIEQQAIAEEKARKVRAKKSKHEVYTGYFKRSTFERVCLYYSKARYYRAFVATRIHDCRCLRCGRNGERLSVNTDRILAEIEDPEGDDVGVDMGLISTWNAESLQNIGISRRDLAFVRGAAPEHGPIDPKDLNPDRRDDLCCVRRTLRGHSSSLMKMLMDLHSMCMTRDQNPPHVYPLGGKEEPEHSSESVASGPRTDDNSQYHLNRLRNKREKTIPDGSESKVRQFILDDDGFTKAASIKLSTVNKRLYFAHCADRMLNAPVLVAENAKGRAVYAAAIIYKGDFVCEYKGLYIPQYGLAKTIEDAHTKEGAGSYMFYFKHPTSLKTNCIDATEELREWGIGRLINHSHKRANLEISVLTGMDRNEKSIARLVFAASRDITIGEELLIDYGETDPKVLQANPWLRD